MHIVLVEPEIPQNTGNVARTCAALGAELHLVHPLGFSVDERSVRRAGLDYWHLVTLHEHRSFAEFLAERGDVKLVLFSSKGSTPYTEIAYDESSHLVFGSETSGLSESVLAAHSGPIVRIPTIGQARCLNLSNAVAVAAYEAARRQGFPGLELSR
ncbi:MAG: tRNA (cytidine(34)-2'-O)-methyltransferase [Spirochaetota bacterium]